MFPIVMKDPKVVAALRLFETAAIVSLLAFLGTLQIAFQSKTGLAGYDWHSALLSLELGVGSGLVNALIAYFNAVAKQVAGTAPVDISPPPSSGAAAPKGP